MLIFRKLYRDDVPGHPLLLAEGLLVAWLGTLFAGWLFPDEASLIAVFFATMLSLDTIERLLNHNRIAIFERGVSPRRANLAMGARLLVLFGGAMLGWSILGLGLPLDQVKALFDHQVPPRMSRSLVGMEFGGFRALYHHNVYVMLFFFMVAIPFRQGGIMLAVAWNASVWGATFGVLARSWAAGGGPPLASAWGRVLAAVGPHMALEATAYVLAGLAGVFISKGLEKHSLLSDVMFSILRSARNLLLLGLALVWVGAVVEANVTPILVGLVTSGF